MSYSVSGTMITLTRGDTFTALITITESVYQQGHLWWQNPD